MKKGIQTVYKRVCKLYTHDGANCIPFRAQTVYKRVCKLYTPMDIWINGYFMVIWVAGVPAFPDVTIYARKGVFLKDVSAKRPRAHFFTLSNRTKKSRKRRNTNENKQSNEVMKCK